MVRAFAHGAMGRRIDTSWGGQIERERNVLFNNALNTFYLRLYGVRHMLLIGKNSLCGGSRFPLSLSE